MKGEQRHPAYLKINAQGKVPALVVRNVDGIDDCILYESQAIVEWLDEQFPGDSLYPIGNERIVTKMWQYWELCIAEEIWPLSRQQVDGVIWRFSFSRDAFFSRGPPAQQSDDVFYKDKITQIYEGTYLSPNQCRRSVLRILHAFQMLENTLAHSTTRYLVGAGFSQADIAVQPRLCKMPQNGILSNAAQKSLFKRVVEYFGVLQKRPSFKKFAVDDDKIWNSGVFPKFVPQW